MQFMGRPSVFVVVLVVVFHILSFSLSLGAEQRKTKVTWQYDAINNYHYCNYKLDIASGLAAAAIFFNLASFLLVMGMTKCYCCAGPHEPSANRFCAILSMFLLIISFTIAQACLLAGVNRNQLRTRTKFFSGQTVPECEIISKGIFSAAAAFSFFCLILSLFYYVTASKCEDHYPVPIRPPSVGMTMFPPPPQSPSASPIPPPYPMPGNPM